MADFDYGNHSDFSESYVLQNELQPRGLYSLFPVNLIRANCFGSKHR